ncbi:MAG: acyltransferase family protein, partial [Lachnospiraceae bacterium]|nr:acyltransferase family protein [Lachnospiraceae bacterium]
MNSKQHYIYIDFLRIFAIFWVMFNHTNTRGFFLFSITDHPAKQLVYLFISIFCKFAVPVFFMISGSLLLPKSESLETIFRKRILRFVMILFVIILLYWLYNKYRWGNPLEISDIFKQLYTGKGPGQLWYLYSYIAILLMLPFLKYLAESMRGSDYLYLAFMFVLFTGILPVIDYLLFKGESSHAVDLRAGLF